jgi:threonine synthase
LRNHWRAARIDDDRTTDIIAATYARHGVLIDPHTAVGLGAAQLCRRDPDIPMVALATAHPAKFPDAVERATGIRPQLPAHLADLLDRKERFATLPNDLGEVQAFVRRVAAS